jgi:hypothetical protein
MSRAAAAATATAAVPVAPAATHEGPVQCSFCLEDTRRPTSTNLACGVHSSCRGCLTQLYITALSDTSLIPVKCCSQLLERSLASIVLSADKLKRYRALEAEATAVRKMYCPKPHCSAFISLDGLNLGSSRCVCMCALIVVYVRHAREMAVRGIAVYARRLLNTAFSVTVLLASICKLSNSTLTRYCSHWLCYIKS